MPAVTSSPIPPVPPNSVRGQDPEGRDQQHGADQFPLCCGWQAAVLGSSHRVLRMSTRSFKLSTKVAKASVGAASVPRRRSFESRTDVRGPLKPTSTQALPEPPLYEIIGDKPPSGTCQKAMKRGVETTGAEFIYM